MKKLVLMLLAAGVMPGLQAGHGSGAAYGLGGLAVGTMIGRATAPRDRTVIVEREAPPEPRYRNGRDRVRALESEVDELRDQLTAQDRKLDQILRELRRK